MDGLEYMEYVFVSKIWDGLFSRPGVVFLLVSKKSNQEQGLIGSILVEREPKHL